MVIVNINVKNSSKFRSDHSKAKKDVNNYFSGFS